MALLFDEALARLNAARKAGRLAHAYLIIAPDDELAQRFVLSLSAQLLDCPIEKVPTHPDFHRLSPESKSRRILIDEIRELEQELNQSVSRGGGVRVAAIFQADRLNDASANAFLKTLEEPLPDTHILLTTSVPDAVLPTIVSRCLELPLRASHPPTLSPRQEIVRNLTLELLDPSHPAELPAIFLAARKFRELISEYRDEVEKEVMASVKEVRKHFKERTDAGSKWAEEQEAQAKARIESAVLLERGKLLETMSGVFAGKLRKVVSAGDWRIGQSQALRLIRQYEAVLRLRSILQLNTNEALAIEAGFLKIFLPE